MSKDGFGDTFMESFAPVGGAKPETKLAWQQQEAVGEYNQTVLKEIMAANQTRPVRVTNVNVFGTDNKFRDRFLQRQLQPLLQSGGDLTLDELLKNVDLTTLNFTKTGSIRNIGLNLSEAPMKSPLFSADTLQVVANLTVLPVKTFFMKVGTNVGNGEGDGYFTLQWKNIFGGGELINFDTNLSSNRWGAKNKAQYMLRLTTPINNSPNFKFDTLAYHSLRNIDYTTFHEEAATGWTNRISTNFLPSEKRLNHELSFENLVRGINMAHSPNNLRGNSLVNDYFLLNAGHSLKSSLTYSLNYDSRDSPVLPREGHYVKLSSEVSLLPGSRFVKNCLESLSAYPLSDTACVNLSLRSGLISSVAGDLIHPMDKFQLGGPNSVRGFLISGMGPKNMGMSIGGDAYFGAGLSLFNKIPFVNKESNLKMHTFANSGRLIGLTPKTGNVLRALTTDVDLTVGMGIVYAHPAARFELNYTLPIVAHGGEETRTGLQWGIGVSFM